MNNPYFMIFCEDQNEDHIIAGNIECNNGHWSGDHPVASAAGWFLLENPESEEEKWRFSSMNGTESFLYEQSYTCYKMKGPLEWGEGGETVIKFRDPPEDSLSWWPFGGW